MNEQKTNQLFIFKRTRTGEERDRFIQSNRVVLKDIPIFSQVCMNFHFKLCNSKEKNTILFCKIDQIFEMNFETEEIITVYKFETQFKRQPLFFQPNAEQTIFLVASPEDGMYLHLPQQTA